MAALGTHEEAVSPKRIDNSAPRDTICPPERRLVFSALRLGSNSGLRIVPDDFLCQPAQRTAGNMAGRALCVKMRSNGTMSTPKLLGDDYLCVTS
jgi:hypothetical protein